MEHSVIQVEYLNHHVVVLLYLSSNCRLWQFQHMWCNHMPHSLFSSTNGSSNAVVMKNKMEKTSKACQLDMMKLVRKIGASIKRKVSTGSKS